MESFLGSLFTQHWSARCMHKHCTYSEQHGGHMTCEAQQQHKTEGHSSVSLENLADTCLIDRHHWVHVYFEMMHLGWMRAGIPACEVQTQQLRVFTTKQDVKKTNTKVEGCLQLSVKYKSKAYYLLIIVCVKGCYWLCSCVQAVNKKKRVTTQKEPKIVFSAAL